jgi:hypothetical protein
VKKPLDAMTHVRRHDTHTPCCSIPDEHVWADPIRCLRCLDTWPCAQMIEEGPENGDCECGQDMDSHSGGFALLHHDEQMRHQAPRLREALLLFLNEYDVDGRKELHDPNCLYRKVWAMADDDEPMEDEPRCIAARAALVEGPK